MMMSGRAKTKKRFVRSRTTRSRLTRAISKAAISPAPGGARAAARGRPLTRPMSEEHRRPDRSPETRLAAGGGVADPAQEPGVGRQEAQLREQLGPLVGREEGAAEDGQHHGHDGDGRAAACSSVLVKATARSAMPVAATAAADDEGGDRGRVAPARPEQERRAEDDDAQRDERHDAIETTTLPATTDHQGSGAASMRASVPLRRSACRLTRPNCADRKTKKMAIAAA